MPQEKSGYERDLLVQRVLVSNIAMVITIAPVLALAKGEAVGL